MSEQQKRKRSTEEEEGGNPPPENPESTSSARQSDEKSAEMDQVLDEIDSILESNAEDFVNSYVQKGGQ